MSRKYTPATFQPTVRPDWGGVLSYIPNDEKATILECIIKYPSLDCNSRFWLETIKPDLDLQYETFKQQCEAKSRGVRNRWGKTSITPVKDENNKSNTDVIVPEGIGIREEEGIEEKEGKIKRIKLKTEDIIDFESLFIYWEQNKKGGKYKPESRQRMFKKLKDLTNNDFEYAKKAIFYAIDNNYQGFTDGSKLYYKEKPKQKTLYEKCVENGLKFLEDTND